MDGILLLNKPILWTSHDAVDLVRRRLGTRRVGHAGTLDPLATGLLVMLIGKATSRADEFSGLDKQYRGTLTLGLSTDTQDLEGRITASTATEIVTEEAVRTVFRELTGVQAQKPPDYSAVSVNGRKLYDWARRAALKPGAEVMPERPSRQITVKNFEPTAFDLPEVFFELDCSKGTYVRALCDEVGQRLGCGATLSSLVRTRVGRLRLEDAWEAGAFTNAASGDIVRSLISNESI